MHQARDRRPTAGVDRLFPSSTGAGRALAEIVTAVEDVKDHAAAHESCRSSAREALVVKAAARRKLRVMWTRSSGRRGQ